MGGWFCVSVYFVRVLYWKLQPIRVVKVCDNVWMWFILVHYQKTVHAKFWVKNRRFQLQLYNLRLSQSYSFAFLSFSEFCLTITPPNTIIRVSISCVFSYCVHSRTRFYLPPIHIHGCNSHLMNGSTIILLVFPLYLQISTRRFVCYIFASSPLFK